MARIVEDAKLESRAARTRLDPRGKPYFRALGPGLHLGYRKSTSGAGRWLIRTGTNGSNYIIETFGDADDAAPADGVEVLDYKQALARARELGGAPPPAAEAFAVDHALDRYLTALERDGRSEAAIKDARWRANALIRPALGAIEVAALSAEQIKRWRDGLVRARPRLRTAAGEKQQHAERDDRSRRATANRTFTTLRAALNLAFHDGKVAHADAWRRVKPFRGVERARIRYLSHAEAGRLINTCDPDFRPLVEAALHTGARYGQLIALTAEDFNAAAGTLRLSSRKGDGTEKIHHAVLTAEGTAFFKRLCAGRAHDASIFGKDTGSTWDKSHQARPMREACERAKIKPAIGFHGLRHTYASHCAMGGVPLLIIARNLGHADTRMCERHYAHLAPSYAADAIRAGAPRFGAAAQDNVVPIDAAR